MRLIVVLDRVDADALADFWSSALGLRRSPFHPPCVRLVDPRERWPNLPPRQVPERRLRPRAARRGRKLGSVFAMTKRLYDRSSRTADYTGLDQALRAAIEGHAQQRLLGEVTPVACVETRSVNLQPRRVGFFGRLAGKTNETENQTVAILLAHALIAATTGAERGVTVMSTRLVDISAINQHNSAQLVDSGIMVESRWGGPETASYYIALGDDPAGRGFHESLRAAVVALRQKG